MASSLFYLNCIRIFGKPTTHQVHKIELLRKKLNQAVFKSDSKSLQINPLLVKAYLQGLAEAKRQLAGDVSLFLKINGRKNDR